MREPSLRTRALGLDLRFDSLSPPGSWDERGDGADDVVLAAAAPDRLEAAWSGGGEPGWAARIDGREFVADRGAAGDHRFLHGGVVLAHLNAAGDTLLCDLGSGGGDGEVSLDLGAGEEVGRWRVLLDSVLFSVALLRGFEALHAGAVVRDGGAIAIAAGAGGGKSTLLAELLDGGAELLSDDVVALAPRPEAAPLAHPGPPLVTVPSTLPRPPGEPLADLGEELWRAVPVAPAPVPLAAIVLLDRGAGGPARLKSPERPLAPLLAALLRFPRTPEREGRRFELAAALAGTVPIRLLRAGAEATPTELAAALRTLDVDTDRGRH